MPIVCVVEPELHQEIAAEIPSGNISLLKTDANYFGQIILEARGSKLFIYHHKKRESAEEINIFFKDQNLFESLPLFVIIDEHRRHRKPFITVNLTLHSTLFGAGMLLFVY